MMPEKLGVYIRLSKSSAYNQYYNYRNSFTHRWRQLKLYGSNLSISSVSLARDVLSSALGHAADEEMIPANIVIGVLKRLKLQRKNNQIDYQTYDPRGSTQIS